MIAIEVYEKYRTMRGGIGVLISLINNYTFKFTTQLMANKLLRKCHKDHCLVATIEVVEMCIVRDKIRWDPFLLNQFILYCIESQNKGTQSHYFWLFIIIDFDAWYTPIKHVKFLELQQLEFISLRYGELWHISQKEEQGNKNIIFYIWI